MSKDVNGWVGNQLTNSDAKLLWASGCTSTNGFLSAGYQPVETRTTSVTLSLPNTHTHTQHGWLCAHFETMMNFFHPQLFPPRPPSLSHSSPGWIIPHFSWLSPSLSPRPHRVHSWCGCCVFWQVTLRNSGPTRVASVWAGILAVHAAGSFAKGVLFFTTSIQHLSLLCQKGSWEMWFCRNATMKRLIMCIYRSSAWSRSNISDSSGHFSRRDVELCAGVGRENLYHTRKSENTAIICGIELFRCLVEHKIEFFAQLDLIQCLQ